MIELRWLEYESLFGGIDGTQYGCIEKKLQYRFFSKGYETNLWSEWIDVPTVKEEK